MSDATLDTPATWPTVSVIVCTHLRPSTLPRALDSVITQSYRDFECIVIHDGPPDDDTKRICEEYATHFERVDLPFIFTSTDEASGYYCVPRNTAICHARGDYIAGLDDDNAWAPRTLEVLVAAMEEGLVWPDFAYGRIRYCFADGARKVHRNRTLPCGVGGHQPWDDMAMARLATGPMANFIDSSSFIAAKGAYWRLDVATGSMFNPAYRRFGDWELLARATHYAGWRGKAVDEVVLDYYWGTPGQLQLTRPLNEQVRGEVVR